MFQLQNIIGLGRMTIGTDPALCRDFVRGHSLFITYGIEKKEREAIIQKRLKDRCRKSSKNYSRKHVFLISCCDKHGFGKCCFCQIPWSNQ